ncbi:NUDIX hydrolase [Luminiphilus sp.]|nr:NUDIX hydrolase [Luminiphilus sp.]
MLTDIDLPSDDREGAIVAGTILLLRDALNGPEVLLLKRNPQAKNMGDVWMFPGGKVEAGDSAPREVEQAANAAVRELQEEAAIVLNTSELICFSHWLTPAGMARRFATWFYVARLPENAAVRVDGEEMVESRWVSPQTAIEEHERGALRLPPPTVVSLQDLAHQASVAQIINAVALRVAPYFFPKVCAQAETKVVMLYPGDAGYEDADPQATGERHRAQWSDGVVAYERSYEYPSP